MSSLVSAEQAIYLIRSVSSDVLWLLDYIEKRRGWLTLPPDLAETVARLGVSNYPLLYEDERRLQLVALRSFADDESFVGAMKEYEFASEQTRSEMTAALIDGLSEEFNTFEFPKTEEERAAARATFEAMTEDERAAAMKQAQLFVCAVLSSFHQTLSVMVTGEKLTSLVQKAKDGDPIAFRSAVRIDRRILEQVPYFRERHERARSIGEVDFLKALGRTFGQAPYNGRIRHKALWWAFSLLDQFGLLSELSHRQILDILDEAGLNLHKNRIEDVNYLTKRLLAYRALQKCGVVSMQ